MKVIYINDDKKEYYVSSMMKNALYGYTGLLEYFSISNRDISKKVKELESDNYTAVSYADIKKNAT